MKSWLTPALACIAFALALGCDNSSADASSAAVTQSQNGETIALPKGESLTIELPGNPTTGYEWTVAQLDPAFLRLADSTYAPDSSAIGSGGTYTFRFETLQPGATTLALAYRRSWETTASDQSFSIGVNILDAAPPAAPADAATLEGTSWKLSAWSASSLDPAGFDITAAFADGQISGRSAVNSYSGPCSAAPNGAFSVGALASTLMAGDGNSMQAESLYHSLLAQATAWRRDGSQLVLSAGAADLLIFTPQ